jgi:hypothetical protein
LSISIDFGAAYSGVTYATSNPPEIHHIRVWPGFNGVLSKVPTCLLYDDLGDIRGWGIAAKTMRLRRGWVRSERSAAFPYSSNMEQSSELNVRFKLTMDPELPYGVHTVLPVRLYPYLRRSSSIDSNIAREIDTGCNC